MDLQFTVTVLESILFTYYILYDIHVYIYIYIVLVYIDDVSRMLIYSMNNT